MRSKSDESELPAQVSFVGPARLGVLAAASKVLLDAKVVALSCSAITVQGVTTISFAVRKQAPASDDSGESTDAHAPSGRSNHSATQSSAEGQQEIDDFRRRKVRSVGIRISGSYGEGSNYSSRVHLLELPDVVSALVSGSDPARSWRKSPSSDEPHPLIGYSVLISQTPSLKDPKLELVHGEERKRCFWVGFSLRHEVAGVAPDRGRNESALLQYAGQVAEKVLIDSFASVLRDSDCTVTRSSITCGHAVIRETMDHDRVLGRLRLEIPEDEFHRKVLGVSLEERKHQSGDGQCSSSRTETPDDPTEPIELGRFCARVEERWRTALHEELVKLDSSRAGEGGTFDQSSDLRPDASTSNWSTSVEVVWRENWLGRYESLLHRDL